MPQQDEPDYVGAFRIQVTVEIPVEDSVESIARATEVSEAMQEAAAKLNAELLEDDVEYYGDKPEESLVWSMQDEEAARTVVCSIQAKGDDWCDTDIVREHVENELYEPTVEDVDIVTREVRKRLEAGPATVAKTQPWCYRVDDTDTGGDGYAAGPFEDQNEAYQSAKAHSVWLAARRDWKVAQVDEWTIVVSADVDNPGDQDTVWFYIEQLQEPVTATPEGRSI
jgi:hypothetical protein